MTPYDVTVDQGRRTLEVVMRGSWTIDTARTYVDALGAAAGTLRRRPGPSWWLIDTTDCPVQTREVATYLGATLPRAIPPQTYVAVVTNAALIAIQAKRIVPDPTHAIFPTVAAARDWLGGQPPA